MTQEDTEFIQPKVILSKFMNVHAIAITGITHIGTPAMIDLSPPHMFWQERACRLESHL